MCDVCNYLLSDYETMVYIIMACYTLIMVLFYRPRVTYKCISEFSVLIYYVGKRIIIFFKVSNA